MRQRIFERPSLSLSHTHTRARAHTHTYTHIYIYIYIYIYRESHYLGWMFTFWLKLIYSVLSALTWRPIPPAVCLIFWSRDSAWVGVFAKFTHINSNVSSIENYINMPLAKASTAIERLAIIWISNHSIKWNIVFSKQQSCQFYYMDAPYGCWLSV